MARLDPGRPLGALRAVAAVHVLVVVVAAGAPVQCGLGFGRGTAPQGRARRRGVILDLKGGGVSSSLSLERPPSGPNEHPACQARHIHGRASTEHAAGWPELREQPLLGRQPAEGDAPLEAARGGEPPAGSQLAEARASKGVDPLRASLSVTWWRA